jgi:hypothetical protein
MSGRGGNFSVTLQAAAEGGANALASPISAATLPHFVKADDDRTSLRIFRRRSGVKEILDSQPGNGEGDM